MQPLNVQRERALRGEADSAFLYDTLASIEADAGTAAAYRQMAATERRHLERLLAQTKLTAPKPSARAATLGWLARRFGAAVILPLMRSAEQLDSAAYRQQPGAAPVAGEENAHARFLVALQKQPGSARAIARLEGRHRSVGGNALRAAILGANDGLVSNLSLVAAVAGTAATQTTIVISGVGGLLAGSISMALGEWLSVQSSRELSSHQLALEAAELEADPQSEETELALLYQAKGLAAEEANRVARQIMQSGQALDTLAREELGIDPQELGGSAWVAAVISFVLFALGAIVPLLPFLLFDGRTAMVAAGASSAVALFALGAAASLMTGRNALSSGLRQLGFGAVAAAVTFGAGKLLGAAVL